MIYFPDKESVLDDQVCFYRIPVYWCEKQVLHVAEAQDDQSILKGWVGGDFQFIVPSVKRAKIE